MIFLLLFILYVFLLWYSSENLFCVISCFLLPHFFFLLFFQQSFFLFSFFPIYFFIYRLLFYFSLPIFLFLSCSRTVSDQIETFNRTSRILLAGEPVPLTHLWLQVISKKMLKYLFNFFDSFHCMFN